MNYSTNPAICRVEIFKPGGKWYTTLSVNFEGFFNYSPREALLKACEKHSPGGFQGMFAMCLQPYTEHSYPAHVKLPGDYK